jgi:hypothetical protein
MDIFDTPLFPVQLLNSRVDLLVLVYGNLTWKGWYQLTLTVSDREL